MRMPALLLGLVAALAGSAGWAQEVVLLSPQEIQQTLVGKKAVAVVTRTGAISHFEMRADGTTQIFFPGGNDSGTWRLDDTGYCTTWRKIRDGRETCFTVRRQGDKLEVLSAEGVVTSTITELR